MFETEVHEDRSVVAFGAQQLGVWIASVIWAFITVSLLVWLSQFGVIGRVFEAVCSIALASVPAFFCGRLVQNRHPHFAVSGHWVWLLPCVFMSALILVFVFRAHVSLAQAMWDLFSPPNDLGGVLGVVFVTYPTLGCFGYAYGIRAQESAHA